MSISTNMTQQHDHNKPEKRRKGMLYHAVLYTGLIYLAAWLFWLGCRRWMGI